MTALAATRGLRSLAGHRPPRLLDPDAPVPVELGVDLGVDLGAERIVDPAPAPVVGLPPRGVERRQLRLEHPLGPLR